MILAGVEKELVELVEWVDKPWTVAPHELHMLILNEMMSTNLHAQALLHLVQTTAMKSGDENADQVRE
jgi:hypothetical protein